MDSKNASAVGLRGVVGSISSELPPSAALLDLHMMFGGGECNHYDDGNLDDENLALLNDDEAEDEEHVFWRCQA